MAQTMSMGQAAGFAAVQSLDEDSSANAISIHKLQDMLLEHGAILELPNKIADITRNGWANNQ